MKKNNPSKDKTTPKIIAGVKSPSSINPQLKKILSKKRKQLGDANYYFKMVTKYG